MKISCKLKTSTALNNQGDLFTWGSSNSGLLGNETEFDVPRPNKVDINYENTSYKIDKISTGHFHVAAIAKREVKSNASTLDYVHFKYCHNMFKKLLDWYEMYFIPNLKTNPQILLKTLLKLPLDAKYIQYDSLENLFLGSFYAHQHLLKKDIFKMEKAYENIIKTEFEIPLDKSDIDLAKLIKFQTSSNKEIKEINIFIKNTTRHFINYPDDFPFFVKLICEFKPFINLKTIKKLFDYMNYESMKNAGDVNPLENEQVSKLSNLFSDLKMPMENGENLIETNKLIDIILNKQTGNGLLFTWGVDTEGRLGIGSKNTDKNDDDDETEYLSEIRYQRTPMMVNFPSVYTKIIKIACGYAHSLALASTHQVYSWGSGKYGCLGHKSSMNAYEPKLIEYDINSKPFEHVYSISCGMHFSMALDELGNVYSWGCGNAGRLGHSDENSVGNPKIIQFFDSEKIKIMSIACGDTHAAGISTSKELFSWGAGNNGMLGHGNYYDNKTPTVIEFFKKIKIDQVFCGSGNSMAISSDYRIYAWGKNSHGMLGVPNYVDKNLLTPTQVIFKTDDINATVNEISLGSMHTMFLLSNGTVYTVGNTISGILGINDVVDKIIIPRKIENKSFYITHTEDIKAGSIYANYTGEGTLKIERNKFANSMMWISTSVYNTAMVTNVGELYMAGEDSLIISKGKAAENNTNKDEVTNNPEFGGKSTTEGGGGGKNIGGIDYMKGDKHAHCWSETIHKITCPELHEKVTYIAVGKTHVICIASYKAYAWGSNAWGKLGLSAKSCEDFIEYPAPIDKIMGKVKMASVSETHSLILLTNGEIFSFGQNMYGKLGIGDINKYFAYDEGDKVSEPFETEPQQVKNIIFAEYITSSNSHCSCIMKYDHNYENSYKVFTWGSGFSGKLGHNNTDDVYEPQRIEELDSSNTFFMQVSLGDEFSLALDKEGRIWGWGRKKYLGFYSDNNVKNDVLLTPKILSGQEKKFKYVSSCDTYSLAIDYQGTLYGFGKISNEEKVAYVQFNPNKPFNFNESLDIVSCGGSHYGAISSSGNVPFTWGSNLFFKCGQKFVKSGGADMKDETLVWPIPKKIEQFYDLFLKNDSVIQQDKEQQNKFNINSTSTGNNNGNSTTAGSENDEEKVIVVKHDKNITQTKLLDEKSEFKNIGLLTEDIKINKKFYETMSEFFKMIKNVENTKQKTILDTENKIISMINKTKCNKNSVYRSEVPKIINMNFQIYEAFINLLQIHPCYLGMMRKELANKKIFIPLVKMIFGRNPVNMRSKRVILMLMGLWNTIFENGAESYKYWKTDRYEDLITYDLYSLIFKTSKENMNVVYDLLAEIVLLYIREICSNPNTSLVSVNDDCDILSIYKDMGELKKKINLKACEILKSAYFRIVYRDERPLKI